MASEKISKKLPKKPNPPSDVFIDNPAERPNEAKCRRTDTDNLRCRHNNNSNSPELSEWGFGFTHPGSLH